LFDRTGAFLFYNESIRSRMSEVKNKKAPSEHSEEVLLIHCTSPTTGSPTDREVILSHASENVSKANDVHEQSELCS
jgi:hypothetical protein